jgi:hypothetical protein
VEVVGFGLWYSVPVPLLPTVVKGHLSRAKISGLRGLELEGSVEPEHMGWWVVVHSHRVAQWREELHSCCSHMQQGVVQVVAQVVPLSFSHY